MIFLQIWESSQITNVYKIRPIRAEFFDARGHIDGQPFRISYSLF